MAFVVDKEELKPGLILFRRGDVKHRNWYCRIRLSKAGRYKMISLQTPDIESAKALASEHHTQLKLGIKHGIPAISRSFRAVARDYLATQKQRLERGEISARRLEVVTYVITVQLDAYVGTMPVFLVGKDHYSGYLAWRRRTGKGRAGGQIKNATIANEVAIFNSVLNYAVKKRYLPADMHFDGKPKFIRAA